MYTFIIGLSDYIHFYFQKAYQYTNTTFRELRNKKGKISREQNLHSSRDSVVCLISNPFILSEYTLVIIHDLLRITDFGISNDKKSGNQLL